MSRQNKEPSIRQYKQRIKKACQSLGTYKPEFDPIIERLAETLLLIKQANEEFKMIGGQTVIRHTNKAGATNLAINPALQVAIRLNQQELQLRETLGLTPKALKKLQGGRATEADPLADVLKFIEFDA